MTSRFKKLRELFHMHTNLCGIMIAVCLIPRCCMAVIIFSDIDSNFYAAVNRNVYADVWVYLVWHDTCALFPDPDPSGTMSWSRKICWCRTSMQWCVPQPAWTWLLLATLQNTGRALLWLAACKLSSSTSPDTTCGMQRATRTRQHMRAAPCIRSKEDIKTPKRSVRRNQQLYTSKVQDEWPQQRHLQQQNH